MARRGGIDLGGTKIEAIVVDDAYEIRGQARRLTPTEGGPAAVVTELAVAMREAASAAGVEVSALGGVGVGAPGEVDSSAGTLARAGNLPGWESVYPLAAELTKDIGVAVRLGNDVRVAVEAERVLGAGARTAPSSACGGGRASAAHSCSTASSGSAAGRPASSVTS